MRAVRSTKQLGVRTRPSSGPALIESSSRLDPLIGTMVSGRYRIQELVASGGMGRVYRATQEPLGRSVAVKVVRHEDDESDDDRLNAQRRLQIEATILAKLHHPNIVTLHDFGEVDGAFHGRSFLAMELLEGRTLQEYLDVERRLVPSRVMAIAEQVTCGLRFAHRRGIIHRDLKPANIILVRDEEGDEHVKLVDFGISKMLERDASTRGLTRTGAVMGTVGYIAPEQLESRTTAASDLFALGVVLFQTLTGQQPFDAEKTIDKDGFAEPARRLRDVLPSLVVPEGLESLIASLLARIPEDRPTTSDVLRQLAECRARVEAPAPPAPSAPPPLRFDLLPDPDGPVATAPSKAPPSVLSAVSAVSAASPLPRTSPRKRWTSLLMPAALVLLIGYAVALTVLFSRSKPAVGPTELATPSADVSQVAPHAAPQPATLATVATPATVAATPVARPPKHVAARPVPTPAPAPPPAAPSAPPPAPAAPHTTIFSTLSTD